MVSNRFIQHSPAVWPYPYGRMAFVYRTFTEYLQYQLDTHAAHLGRILLGSGHIDADTGKARSRSAVQVSLFTK